MKDKELTLEQLEEMEADLLQIEEQKDGHYAQLINIYKEMHSKLILLAKKNPINTVTICSILKSGCWLVILNMERI